MPTPYLDQGCVSGDVSGASPGNVSLLQVEVGIVHQSVDTGAVASHIALKRHLQACPDSLKLIMHGINSTNV